MGVMSHRPTIPQHSFDTILDVEQGGHDVVTIPTTSPWPTNGTAFSTLHYHRLMADLSGVIRAYVKFGRSYAPQNLIAAMHEIEKLEREAPSHLRRSSTTPDSNLDQELGPWIPLQRYFAQHAIHFMRLTVCHFVHL